MSKKMLIDATHAEETRVVVVDGNKVEEFDFETLNKRQLAGNIYLAKVTRVEPSLQAAFVDYGGNRHGFLAFAEIHPDYYQIPVADRKALLDEERQAAREEEEEENRRDRRKQRPRPAPKAAAISEADPVVTAAVEVSGMEVVDLHEDAEGDVVDALVTDLSLDEAAVEGGAPEVDTAELDAAEAGDAGTGDTEDKAGDHASDSDDEIESIAEEDVAEEISAPRRTPRARRYKIQEVIKVRQIMLVQVVKEERGNKGAALTTYLSLAGRYCVLMPNTARGGGISRKITQAADRKKLKEIAGEMEVPEGAGLIIRTAGAKRTKPEIKRDYEYLMRLWEQIRELTMKSIAPAKIYEEGDLIKRTIRDLYSREIEEILVEGEAGYRTAKDFMRMIMPSHAKQVKRYDEPNPLFARYQVESYLGGMFNPTVQLKSGGYIVIGVTEALVAIDVNSGRATKEGSIEETALKTNLEACDEVARQLRLRDLAGLIVIDFIDMEERKNNIAVEKRLKDKLKTDRARIQIGRISGFGLMEMSRQRLRPGMLESTTQPCPHCHGTGLIRSDDSMALQILRALEEEGTRKRSKEVLLKAPIGIVNFLINNKREHIALIEARYAMSVRIEADPTLVSPDYAIEKFKTATRVVPETPVISGHAGLMGAPVDEDEDEDLIDDIAEEEEQAEEASSEAAAEGGQPARENGDGNGKKKRRRRRRRRGGRDGETNGETEGADSDGEAEGDDTEADAAGEVVAAEPVAEAAPEAEAAPKKRVTRTRKPRNAAAAKAAPAAVTAEAPAVEAVAEVAAEAPAEVAPVAAAPVEAAPAEAEPAPKKRASRARKPKVEVAAVEAPAAEAEAPAAVEATEAPVKAAPKPRTRAKAPAKAKAAAVTEAAVTEAAAPVEAAPAAAPAPAPAAAEPAKVEPAPAAAADDAPAKPRRTGWWSKK
ncbi:ribonuclease E/G [Xinfangfangia sp. CPCC 101601]|uniref:Ribonuclease E n=1 Tax=Pseudogemmobacter lacusdianii TaxID=3069608 RepID=A0ABU0VTI0_9RHOB|nr:ribonuclease E/G [Xinfangfangia sp. CPCC 101601]MDQ2065041.1 ribonuclease E/G [Xinfangfangia sp. CPCC 101601]